MKLSKVEITNFRCFEHLEIELQPDVNVFVGVNGAGKSSLLDAMAIVLYDIVAANGGGGKRQRDHQRAALKPSDIHVLPQADESTRGRKDFVQLQASANEFYGVPGFPDKTPAGNPAYIEWTNYIQYRPPNNFDYGNNRDERLSPIYRYFEAVWQEIRQSDERALIPLPVVAYYRASRRFSEMPVLGDIFKPDFGAAECF